MDYPKEVLEMPMFSSGLKNRDVAENTIHLHYKGKGTYLLRPSSSGLQNLISLAVSETERTIHHLHIYIEHQAGGLPLYYLSATMKFTTLQELLSHHAKKAIAVEEDVYDLRLIHPVIFFKIGADRSSASLNSQGEESQGSSSDPSQISEVDAGNGSVDYLELLEDKREDMSPNSSPMEPQSPSSSSQAKTEMPISTPKAEKKNVFQGFVSKLLPKSKSKPKPKCRSKSFSVEGQEAESIQPQRMHRSMSHNLNNVNNSLISEKTRFCRPPAPLPVPPQEDATSDEFIYSKVSINHDFFDEIYRFLKETEKCECGLCLEDAELPCGWAIHLSQADETIDSVFFQKGENTSWDMPKEILPHLSQSKITFILTLCRLKPCPIPPTLRAFLLQRKKEDRLVDPTMGASPSVRSLRTSYKQTTYHVQDESVNEKGSYEKPDAIYDKHPALDNPPHQRVSGELRRNSERQTPPRLTSVDEERNSQLYVQGEEQSMTTKKKDLERSSGVIGKASSPSLSASYKLIAKDSSDELSHCSYEKPDAIFDKHHRPDNSPQQRVISELRRRQNSPIHSSVYEERNSHLYVLEDEHSLKSKLGLPANDPGQKQWKCLWPHLSSPSKGSKLCCPSTTTKCPSKQVKFEIPSRQEDFSDDFVDRATSHIKHLKVENGSPNSSATNMTQMAHSQAMHSQVHSQPTYFKAIHSQAICLQPVYSQPMYPQAKYSQPVLSQPVYPQAIHSQPVLSQPVYPQAIHSHPLHPQGMHPPPVHSQPKYSQAIHSQYKNPQGMSSQLIYAQPLATRLLHVQTMHSQPVEIANVINSQKPSGPQPSQIKPQSQIHQQSQNVLPAGPQNTQMTSHLPFPSQTQLPSQQLVRIQQEADQSSRSSLVVKSPKNNPENRSPVLETAGKHCLLQTIQEEQLQSAQSMNNNSIK